MAENNLMLALWREAGRHADATDSIPLLAGLLAASLPVSGLRLDERSHELSDLVTLAEWSARNGLGQRGQSRGCTAAGMAAFERWAGRRELIERTPGEHWPTVLRDIDPGTDRDWALAGALLTGDGVVGLAVLRAPRAFGAAEKALFQAALEPLAAVVGNDFRLREIRRLSARAEADRDSLLTRLGRDSLNETVVGADGGLRAVLERVEQVARTNASVLLLGETGSGKEVIARAIHERSPRRDGPFIRVNCGAVPPDLIDSELLGHEKGSFTGALGVRRGWFERADGGTLFLDEIGELAPAVQVRLLRVLQDHVVQRIGGEREQTVDVRVVAATHRDLPELVQEGRFREDLWYRIAVFPIILPPLRERPEDLPALARHFIQRAAKRAGLHEPPLDAAALERLGAYAWPGNVRELGAVIERAVILGQGVRLDVEAALGPAGAPVLTRAVAAANATSPPAQGDGVGGVADGIVPLEQAIAQHIEKAVARCGGRIDGPHGAARLLGLNTSTLRSKMRKLGLSRGL
jgi:transcriptional regulator with GAF, ATPase, and Fis domain